MRTGWGAAATLIAVAVGVAACTSGAGESAAPSAPAQPPITLTSAWARPSVGMADAMAVYLVIANRESKADTLVGATSDVATNVAMHETVVVPASPASDGMAVGSPSASGDMMAMQPVSRIEIPAGGTVELKPGGYHIMLTGLTRQLKAGDTFNVTLTFDGAGQIPVTVTVRDS